MKKVFNNPTLLFEEYNSAEAITVSTIVLSEDIASEGETAEFDQTLLSIFQ